MAIRGGKPSLASRKGLVKKETKKESPFVYLGSKLNKGEISMVSVWGELNSERLCLFDRMIFSNAKTLLKRVWNKYRLIFEKVEAVEVIKWDKYGRRIK